MARATLRRALRTAEQDGILTKNSVAVAEGMEMDQREGRGLTPEQAEVFLRSSTSGPSGRLTWQLGIRRELRTVGEFQWGPSSRSSLTLNRFGRTMAVQQF